MSIPFYADAYAQTYSKISPLAAEAATIAPGEVLAATHSGYLDLICQLSSDGLKDGRSGFKVPSILPTRAGAIDTSIRPPRRNNRTRADASRGDSHTDKDVHTHRDTHIVAPSQQPEPL
jgi:hypothetical protein